MDDYTAEGVYKASGRGVLVFKGTNVLLGDMFAVPAFVGVYPAENQLVLKAETALAKLTNASFTERFDKQQF